MKKSIIFMIIVGAMILSLCSNVSAVDMNATPLPDYRHIFINVSNDEGVAFNLDSTTFTGPNNTYYIKCDGGGQNALHITTNTSNQGGQVTLINSTSNSSSGVLYITDTGGKKLNDNVILLLSVKGPISDDFSIRIRSSGYGNWTLLPVGSSLPPNYMPSDYSYMEGAIDQIFNKTDFLYGPQTWRPGPAADLRIILWSKYQ